MDDLIELKDQYEMQCPHCRKILARIICTSTKDDEKIYKTRYQCTKCYNCGLKSLNTKVFYGRCHVSSPNNNIQIDYEDYEEESDGTIKSLFTTRKTT